MFLAPLLWWGFLYVQIDKVARMKALEVASFVVDYALKHDLEITNFELQKVLLALQLHSLKLDLNKPMIEDTKFIAWKALPVLTSVYYAYCYNGGLPINQVVLRDDFEGEIVIPKASVFSNYAEIVKIIKVMLTVKPWLVQSWLFKLIAFKNAIKKTLEQEQIKYNVELSTDDLLVDAKTFDLKVFIDPKE